MHAEVGRPSVSGSGLCHWMDRKFRWLVRAVRIGREVSSIALRSVAARECKTLQVSNTQTGSLTKKSRTNLSVHGNRE